MSGFGRVSQEYVEALGSGSPSGRLTQEYVEVLGKQGDKAAFVSQLPVEVLGPQISSGGDARVTQEYAEVIGAEGEATARVTQLYGEILGSGSSPVRITQLPIEVLGAAFSHVRITQQYVELLGRSKNSYCSLNGFIEFAGSVSGSFYQLRELGSETVPIAMVDSSVTLSWLGKGGTPTQTITQDGGWVAWAPLTGPLHIEFADGKPVAMLWVVTSQGKSSPPLIYVWAFSTHTPLWKQNCIPPVTGAYETQLYAEVLGEIAE